MALALEKKMEHSYPAITAGLSLLVIFANVCLIIGMVLAGNSIQALCNGAADGSLVVLNAAVVFENDIAVFESDFNNYTTQASVAIALISNTSALVKASLFNISAGVAATADAAVKAELMAQATKQLEKVSGRQQQQQQ